MQDYTITGNPTTDAINKARAGNIATGIDPYSGAGATQFSASAGLGGVSIPSNISSGSLQPATPINLPSAPVDTTSSSITGRSQAIIEQDQLNRKIAQDQADKQAQLDSQKGLLSKALGSITDLQTNRASAEGDVNTAGTPAYLKEQARLIANKLDASNKAQLEEIKALDGFGLTDVQKNQKLAEIKHRYGLADSDLQFQYHIQSGDYNAAEDALNTKFQLDLAPLKTQLDYQTGVYNDIKDSLTKAEDRQWTNLINQSNQALQTEQQNKADISKLFTALNTNNPGALKNDPSLGVKLANAKDATEFNQILASKGISLDNPLDAAYKKAQINSLNATAASKAGGTANGGVSQALQDAINNGTIDPNRINSRTLGIYNAIAAAGTDAVGSHAGAAGETKAITDLSTYKSTATRTLGVLESNLPLVEALADKVNTIGIPTLDAYLSGKKAVLTNDPNVIKYINSLKTLRAEYAQMLAKGAVATEGDKRDAEQAIPAGLSSAGYAALGEQLKLEANNILAASDAAIQSAKSKSASNNGSTDLTSQFDNLFKQFNGQ